MKNSKNKKGFNSKMLRRDSIGNLAMHFDPEEDESEGLDLSSHGERGYDL